MSLQKKKVISLFLVFGYCSFAISQTNGIDWKHVFEHAIEQDSAKNSNEIYKETKVKRPFEMEILGTFSTAYKFEMAIGRVKTTGGGITSLIYLLIVDSKKQYSFSFVSNETEENNREGTEEINWQILDMSAYKSLSDSTRFFVSLNSAISIGGWYIILYYSKNSQTIDPYLSIQYISIGYTPDNYLLDGEIQTGGPIEASELYKFRSNSDFIKYVKFRFHPSLYDAIAIKNDGISLQIDPINLNSQSTIKKYIGKIQYNINIGMQYASLLPGYFKMINFSKVVSFSNENERDVKKTKLVEELYQSLLKQKPWLMDSNNLTFFNDIGYFLEQSSKYQAAVDVLSEVTEKFPERTPAYLNLGDAYFGLQNIAKAKEAYLNYIEHMKKEGKEAKIPKRVFERVQ